MGVIHEKVSFEKTVAYSTGHSSSSEMASYPRGVELRGQSHSTKNSTTERPKPMQ